MNRVLASFYGGLRLPTFKSDSDSIPSVQAPLPDRLILPLQQHIGLSAVPCVKTGDKVLKGQVIARAEGYVSVPLHASTSGRVLDIGDYPVAAPTERHAPCIVIEPDGEDAWADITPIGEYASLDPAVLQQAILDSGMVGLGGAGFPTHVKIREGVEDKVDTLIINGVECEPYISCDDRLIQEKTRYVVNGTRMIRHAVQAKHCVIAVEDDMPEAYAALAEHITDEDDIELIRVPTRYPAGGEKQLIKVITGREVPSGGLAIHIGVVMQNVATAAAMYRAVTRGEPVVSRYVTIAGDAVEQPRNLQVLIGTPIRHCLALCAHRAEEECEVILGGPMMGTVVTDTGIPVIKTTHGILVRTPVEQPAPLPCIRCGDCADVCPARLLPQQLYWSARNDDFDAEREQHLFDCIECGLCAYVCPSHIPLVHYFRHAKGAIAAAEREREGRDRARARYLRHEAHLAADEDRAEDKPADPADGNGDRRDVIRAAVERTRARRKKKQNGKESDNE